MNFGDIPSNLAVGAGQSVRRNSANTAFEAFAPGGLSGVLLPPVTITEPAMNDTVTGTVTFAAEAFSSALDIAEVKWYYYDGGFVLLDTLSAAPYDTTFDTTTVSDGDFIVAAIAVDTSGNQSLPSYVVVTVDNSAPVFTNWALASNGSTATATGSYNGNLLPDRAINGYRHTNGNWNASGTGSGWGYDHNGTLEIAFNASRTITEIDLFTLADDYNGTTDPTLSDTFTLYGQVNFAVDYWNGSAWVNITTVTGNDKVWRQFTFTAVTTTKIRVVCTGSGGGEWSRIVEVEAWG